MANTVSAAYELKLVTTETLDLGADHVPNPEIVHNLGSIVATLNASSTVPATKASSDTIALVAGVATIDLTALTGLYGASVDFTGLKVQAVMIINPAGNNAEGMEFAVAIANGYNLFGKDNADSDLVTVLPGDAYLVIHANTLEDVDATHKDITVTGTLVEEFDIHMVAG